MLSLLARMWYLSLSQSHLHTSFDKQPLSGVSADIFRTDSSVARKVTLCGQMQAFRRLRQARTLKPMIDHLVIEEKNSTSRRPYESKLSRGGCFSCPNAEHLCSRPAVFAHAPNDAGQRGQCPNNPEDTFVPCFLLDFAPCY